MVVDLAVIPAAGKGTRMRPATRVVPKALIPLVDKPTIQYVVEEAVRAGAAEVVLVVDPGEGALVERHFHEEGPLPGLEQVKITSVTQHEQLGLGHAILTAREVVGDRPFFSLLADGIVLEGQDVLPSLNESANGLSVVAVRRLSDEWLERYGVVAPGDWLTETVVEVTGAVEKPGVDAAPSNLGLVGRYLFTPEVFDHLATLRPGQGGEIQITDTIDWLGSQGRCRAVVIDSEPLDMGNPLGLLEASTLTGLGSPEHGTAYREFLRGLVDDL